MSWTGWQYFSIYNKMLSWIQPGKKEAGVPFDHPKKVYVGDHGNCVDKRPHGLGFIVRRRIGRWMKNLAELKEARIQNIKAHISNYLISITEIKEMLVMPNLIKH